MHGTTIKKKIIRFVQFGDTVTGSS